MRWLNRSTSSARGTRPTRKSQHFAGSRPRPEWSRARRRHRPPALSLLRTEDRRRESRPSRARSEAQSSADKHRSHATVRPRFRCGGLPARRSALTCSVAADILFFKYLALQFCVIRHIARRRSCMRRAAILFVACFCSGSLALAAQEHHHELSTEEVGSVRFPISCSKAAELSVNRAVALLHSFQYEQARQAFKEISTQDPTCAMAQWGVAMSHYHGLWDNGDTHAGRLALKKAAEIAASNAKTTPREKSYIEALAEIYAEDGQDPAARSRALEKTHGDVQAPSPAPNQPPI